jgi:hypothetical protein
MTFSFAFAYGCTLKHDLAEGTRPLLDTDALAFFGLGDQQL